ncbi:hypothetical protein T09_4891 [Trichinella sp. T9]|nr:hypothetical protein T09_4891 [Trichinella sp. T9]
MKFDGFRHPREQVAPITLAGTFRNQPVRLLFYRNPFLGLFFTIGFILLPYVGHQLDKKGKRKLSCESTIDQNFEFIGFATARKDLMRQLDERKRSHSNGEVQFERDYHYLKHHLFHSWEKNNHYIQNKRLPLYRCNTNLGILRCTDTYASRRDIWNSVVCSSNTHGMEQLRLALSGERWKDYLEKSAKSQMPEELTKQQYQRMRLCSQTTELHTSMVKEEENDRALLTSTF